MKNLIQLSESDYQELINTAKLNETEIDKKANDLYQEKGTFGINITMSIVEDWEDKLFLKSTSFVNDWNGKYPISDQDKKKIVKFVEYKSQDLFESSFEEHLYHLNNIKKPKQ